MDGEERLTQQDYLHFINEFGLLGFRYANSVNMINATRYGAYLENWSHAALDDHHPVISSRVESRGGP